MPHYNPATLEKEIQKIWEENKIFEVDNTKKTIKKYYACSMLPYPSGKLHMGHVRNYTINDVIARWKRMNGYNVLMPMGWDAFGLPAENAALLNAESPSSWTQKNIKTMRNQLKALGFAIDWSKEISTCSTSYYKWNQWFFLKMLEKGIAYKKTGSVNWDPVDKTVLANEQVIDGKGWRSGATVEKRNIPMYYLAITKFSDDLIEGIKNLNWPERVVTMQKNWIGKSIGLRFSFHHEIRGFENKLINEGKLFVFTTRPDTIMGATFIAISPEHDLAKHVSKLNKKVASFIKEDVKQNISEAEFTTQEKKGINTGLKAFHPITKNEISIWIANYVLIGYGDGAVMGVPAHDERDFEFANKYSIEIKQVIRPSKKSKNFIFDAKNWQDWYSTKDKTLCINSAEYSGLSSQEAIKKITEDFISKGIGEQISQTRLRDWVISRQRYWGTPIPIINCKNCGSIPVPYDDLPVELPKNLVCKVPGNPLEKCNEFLDVHCPKCGIMAKRETDTMDTFIDSSWYFMRYCCPESENQMVNEKVNSWMPVDQYIGGIEHAVLHLLYARFWTKVMHKMDLINFEEPFKKLLTQGMVLNQTFYRKTSDEKIVYFNPEDVLLEKDSKGKTINAKLIEDNLPVFFGNSEKMSKSKNNGVDPQTLINKYGADTARLFMMFAAPPEHTLEWSEDGVEGAYKFLKRLWSFCEFANHNINENLVKNSLNLIGEKNKSSLRRKTHEILVQANYDMERFQYNTVVSASMKLLNLLEENKKNNQIQEERQIEKSKEIMIESLSILIRLLYPITPHICYHLWYKLKFDIAYGDLTSCQWPLVDQYALIQDEISITLQINGKVRDRIKVNSKATNDEIEQIALNSDAYKKFSDGKKLKKAIIVPGRLINLVV